MNIKMDRHYSHLHNRLIYKFLLLSICISHVITEEYIKTAKPISEIKPSRKSIELATISHNIRQSKAYKWGYNRDRGDSTDYRDDQHDDNHDDNMDNMDNENNNSHMKAMSQPKADYWTAYYDFLINEGSYKFWAVFQLATAALLIYSAFAALYYAKVNPAITDDDFDDIFRRRRRRRRSLPLMARERPFAGLDTDTFQRIIEATDAK